MLFLKFVLASIGIVLLLMLVLGMLGLLNEYFFHWRVPLPSLGGLIESGVPLAGKGLLASSVLHQPAE